MPSVNKLSPRCWNLILNVFSDRSQRKKTRDGEGAESIVKEVNVV